MNACPKCTSAAPHMHPAVQAGGEVELCTDAFHLTPTAQNTQEFIDAVADRLRAAGLKPFQIDELCRKARAARQSS